MMCLSGDIEYFAANVDKKRVKVMYEIKYVCRGDIEYAQHG